MLVAKNITKKFSGVTALDNINLELHPGKVNAIIGENGAGKSTLMKIFSGVHTQYEGEIILNDKPVNFSSTKEAEAVRHCYHSPGIKSCSLFIYYRKYFFRKRNDKCIGAYWIKRKCRKRQNNCFKRLNLDIDPDTKISSLKVGQQQLVEIAKALHARCCHYYYG